MNLSASSKGLIQVTNQFAVDKNFDVGTQLVLFIHNSKEQATMTSVQVCQNSENGLPPRRQNAFPRRVLKQNAGYVYARFAVSCLPAHRLEVPRRVAPKVTQRTE